MRIRVSLLVFLCNMVANLLAAIDGVSSGDSVVVGIYKRQRETVADKERK